MNKSLQMLGFKNIHSYVISVVAFFIMGIAVLLLASDSKEYNDSLFFIGIVILPMLVMFLEKNMIRPLLPAIAMVLVWTIFYLLFTDYSNRPWFQAESGNCDGPCFGWYLFEETPIDGLLLASGAISIITALAIKAIFYKIRD